MDLFTHTLPNGIRLVHMPVNSPVAHCGILVNTGSRDELANQHGLAHFIEHVIFKGTKKRKAHHILSRMEDVGGEINAYTTKEETCVHASFFNNYYDRAFELMSDIVFNSVFPEKEMDKEREVIIDEINSYKDSPFEEIYDEFEEIVFRNNPLGKNILGSKEGLLSYTRKDIIDFHQKNYPTNEMVISSVSNVPFKKILTCFKKYFENIPLKIREFDRILYNSDNYSKSIEKRERNTYQSHCVIGNQAYSANQEERLTLHLLNNLLGGPGMNSRLNMTLREKKGLAYNIESNYSTYSDAGILNIYFGTDRKNLDRCIDLILKELKLLRETALGTVQLQRAKKQLIGQIAISAEINENQMFSIGHSMLLFDRIESLEETSSKIEKITSGELLQIANEIFDEGKLSSLIYF
jgi:predicted Zn-dependent peptidase